MSVHQKRDGRWFVVWLQDGKQRTKHFGRGEEGKAKAIKADKTNRLKWGFRRKDCIEHLVSIRLAKDLRVAYNSRSVKTEVRVNSGYVDILTPEEVIEIKDITRWKSAIGQVLSYQTFFPDHKPRIHLFGYERSSRKKISMIIEACQKINVKLSLDDRY